MAGIERRRLSGERLAALGTAGVVALLFSQAILSERVFFYRDIHAYWYPKIASVVRAVAEGAWPTWNPYIAFGGPMLAEPDYQIGYPFAWLNLLLPPAAYFKLFVLTHSLGTGLGALRLARALQLQPLPAFVGAAAWASSGPLLSSVSAYHHFAGAAWMPWVLLAFLNALADRSPASGLILGAAAGLQILAGSGDMCVMTGLICAMLGLTRLPDVSLAGVVQALAKPLCVAVAFALALGAVQWLPTFSILPHASRQVMGREGSTYWSVHPLSLADLVFPRLVADFPMSDGWRALLLESREPFLACLYLGAPAAGVALLAVLGRRTPQRAALGLGFLLLLAAALGRHTPLHLLLAKLPVVGLLRYPVKYLIPAGLLWSLLLAKGMELFVDDWSEDDRRRARWAAAAALLLSVAGALLAALLLVRGPELDDVVRVGTGPGAPGLAELLAPTSRRLGLASGAALASCLLLAVRSRRAVAGPWLTAVLAALVLADLVWVGRGVNGLAPPELMTHRAPLLKQIEPEARVFAFPYSSARLGAELKHGPLGWEPEWRFALGLQELLRPPIGARWRLHGSYDGDLTGLAAPEQSLLSQLVVEHEARPLGLKLLQLASVDYVLALSPVFGGLPEIARSQSVFAEPIRLFRVPDALPRAYVVDGVRAASGNAAILALADPSFDPRKEVVLPEPSVPASPRDEFRGACRVLWRRPDALSLEAELNAPGFLVLTEAHHPGWRAEVDGAAEKVLRANVLFRAVPLPAGRHRVALSYRPAAPLLGASISAAAALLGLAACGLLWPKRRGVRA